MIICLCGSTKFKDTFHQVAKRKTLEGHIVVMPHVFGHSGDHVTPEQKAELDELHIEKIRISDQVLVINVDGYIGEGTLNEIRWAKVYNKPVSYLNGVARDTGY